MLPGDSAAHQPTPFCFHSEEYPDPTPKDFQKLHKEDTTFDIVEMIQMRGQLQAPRTSQHQVNGDDSVVDLMYMEEAILAQPKRMIVLVSRGIEQGQVPVFSDVPPK